VAEVATFNTLGGLSWVSADAMNHEMMGRGGFMNVVVGNGRIVLVRGVQGDVRNW